MIITKLRKILLYQYNNKTIMYIFLKFYNILSHLKNGSYKLYKLKYKYFNFTTHKNNEHAFKYVCIYVYLPQKNP